MRLARNFAYCWLWALWISHRAVAEPTFLKSTASAIYSDQRDVQRGEWSDLFYKWWRKIFQRPLGTAGELAGTAKDAVQNVSEIVLDNVTDIVKKGADIVNKVGHGIDPRQRKKKPGVTVDEWEEKPLLGENIERHDQRLDRVANVAGVASNVEDFETRLKPPFLSIPGQMNEDAITKQQRKGIKGLFDTNPDDFRDCMLVHQYAAPLHVIDSFHAFEAVKGELRRDDSEEYDEEPFLVRPGALYDGSTGEGSELHVRTSMFANLDGITNPVQVVPSGNIAKWNTKVKVPIAGYLCMPQGLSDSSPVLTTLPTPCVPASLDGAGNVLDPTVDTFDIWIANVRLTFADKQEAEKFCNGLADTIAADLKTQIWDLDRISTLNISTWEYADHGDVSVPKPSKNKSLTHDKNARDVQLMGMPQSPLLQSPNLMSFCLEAAVHSTPQGWTKGTKKLLVLITDWKDGDNSLQPYSHQMPNAVDHYRKNIFPKVKEKFVQMSYGQFDVDVTVVPEVVRYTRNRNTIQAKLPFPGLYEQARTALQGHPQLGQQYLFRDYDLTFVIHPQTNPVGTKGLAWVGSRGAICNGCETISDSFKVMVAVHELGHNLGLHHASSDFLEYGNPFDFMGNYPDVVGLNYGVGYKVDLGWIPQSSIYEITDATVGSLNEVVVLTPFDRVQAPAHGEVVGVKISLNADAQDYWLSFRSTAAAKNRGLFIVRQEKNTATSKLVDAGCHSMSQQDAHLRKGWTFLDASETVVVKVVQETAQYLKVHVYRTPNGNAGPIRARAGFTDGLTKCPVTCQDSDLLISHTCEWMKSQGYCDHGSAKIHGRKLNIGLAVCPETCGKCDTLIKSTPLEVNKAACLDRNVKISGLTCQGIAEKDMCNMQTTAGVHVGNDICPMSCGQCPSITPAGGTPDSDPAPAREIGLACSASCSAPTCVAGSANNGGQALSGNTCVSTCSPVMGGKRYCGTGPTYTAAGAIDCRGCQAPQCPAACQAGTCVAGGSDNGGTPLQGNACTNRCSNVYGGKRYCGAGKSYLGDGTVDCSGCWGAAMLVAHPIALHRSRQQRSDKGGGAPAPVYAVAPSPAAAGAGQLFACEDDETWRDPHGDSCQVYKRTIEKWGLEKACKEYMGGLASSHCRATCGSCVPGSNSIQDASPACVDNACISPWQSAFGRCYSCADFAKGCTDPRYKAFFETECPVTCGVCKPAKATPLPSAEVTAADDKCDDEDAAWCKELGKAYCSENAFGTKCRKTCNFCAPAGAIVNECVDKFSSYSCSRYASYGWCNRKDTRDAIRLQCPWTCGVCGPLAMTTTTIQRTVTTTSPTQEGLACRRSVTVLTLLACAFSAFTTWRS